MVRGAFKVPTLRNIDLFGPYARNGSVLTLAQILDLYSRGGNFPAGNAKNLHPAIPTIEKFFSGQPPGIHTGIVAFLRTLTDERVKEDAAPFDHPALFIPNWNDPDNGPMSNVFGTGELFGNLPAVGALGRTAQTLTPIGPFLADLGPQLTPPADIQFVDPFAPAP